MSLSEEQIHTLHEVISQFRVLQDALPGQLQDIRDHLHSLDQRIDAINHAVPTIQPQTNIKIRLPTTFDGRSSQCNTFFSQLSIYFAANPSYDTDERKIMLAISCVSGPVFTFLEPFIAQINSQNKPDILINYDMFKAQIIAAFGDSDPIITAENQLRRLRQDNHSVTTYATKFRMYAQVVKWNDAALISQFKVNLNSIVQNELARRDDIESLDNLIAEAIDIDNKLVRGPNQRRHLAVNQQQPTSSDMEIDSKPFGKISKEERDRRNNSRACYYCGDPSHFRRECPKANTGHRLNTFVLTIFTPKTNNSAFHSLPMVNIVKETATSIHAQIAHADNGLIFVPLVFGNMVPGEYTKVQALLDTGATHSVVSHKFVESINLLMDTVAFTNVNFVVGNGQHVESNSKLATQIRLSNSIFHNEYHEFHVVKDCSFKVILGIDWIQKHNVELDFSKRLTTIKCADTRVCCPLEPIVKPIVNMVTLENLPSPTPSFESCDTSFEPEIAVPPMDPSVYKLFSPIIHDLNKNPTLSNYSSGLIELPSDYTLSSNSQENTLTSVVTTITTSEQQDTSKNQTTLPAVYQDFAKVFSKTEADKLPPHRPYDHKIPLVPDAVVPYGPMYSMSQLELKALYDYIQENLAKGFIRRSESPAGAPVLFVKKKDGSLRMVVDYRGLNKVTIATPTVLPLISETLDRLNQAKYFTKLDMVGAYNLIRLKPGEEWKSAWICRYGHFEYTVMSFGLCSAPATFQAFVNDVLRDYLDQFLVVYLDDVLIFSQSRSQHEEHVRLVLQKLQDARLSLKLEKCEFSVSTVSFLGFIIGTNGISMDPEKIKAIQEWKPCRSVHDIQVFLGLTNFYRRFIKDYSKICTPLTALLKKDVKFEWSEAADQAFNALKASIVSDPVLRHYDPARPCIIETDASDYALGAVCSQDDSEGVPHPVAFFSRKLLPAEQNYQIYDKELLAIIAAFKHWRPYLEFSREPTIVMTDHKNLEYFTTTRNLSRRQVRWAEILADYNFIIKYRPGKLNGAADALSRRDKLVKEGGEDFSKTAMTLLDPAKFVLNAMTQVPLQVDSSNIQDSIIKGLEKDSHFGTIIAEIKNKPENHDVLSNYTLNDNILFFDGRICVPDIKLIKKRILEECHDAPSAGHFGVAKTYDQVARNYYWPGLRKYIKDYIAGCDTCTRSKNHHHKPYGLLSSLPIPDAPWMSISVDFITQLPPSKKYTAICVFVDRFSKMALFAPTFNQVDAEGTVDLFFKHVFCLFGLPQDIVSDRGVTFTSKFTQAILKSLNVKQKLSTAFHPQTDGQTERVNSILEQYLRCYVNYQQSDWSDYLPIAQFAYNNSKHSSTDTTPFYAVFGYHPRLSIILPRSTRDITPADTRITQLRKLHQDMNFHIAHAQEKHQEFYNRKVVQGPKLNIGDKVWLSSRNIKSQRPTPKLDYKRLGPFKIISKIGSRSYKLELPSTMRIHPVFHVNLLEPYQADTIPGRQPQPVPPIIVDEHQEYEVEDIVDSRIRRNQVQYLVHWKGYNLMDRTWEPFKNVMHCQDLLKKFHAKHPSRPRPSSLHGARP